MVLLTMTPAVVAAIQICEKLAGAELEKLKLYAEPSLAEPSVGKPISHGQLLEIAKILRNHSAPLDDGAQTGDEVSYRLSDLLYGSKIYVAPPKPKPEPTPEYKALMRRLRKEEEARAYERMTNPQVPPETFSQRFATSPHAYLFPTAADMTKEEDEEMTYADVNRQLTLIFNVLVSVIACGVCIWLVARHWSTPARLGLSMSGSVVVAIAEVGIYSAYIHRLKDAKTKEKRKVERKKVVKSWATEPSKPTRQEILFPTDAANDPQDAGVRNRKGKHR